MIQAASHVSFLSYINLGDMVFSILPYTSNVPYHVHHILCGPVYAKQFKGSVEYFYDLFFSLSRLKAFF